MNVSIKTNKNRKTTTALYFVLMLSLLFFVYKSYANSPLVGLDEYISTSSMASDPDKKIENPIIVELFTSQGCSSCPPAESLLRKLSQNPEVLTLEFHVDYWNKTSHMFSGNWVDPYSSPAATTRQRNYNYAIDKSSRIYTPQIVVDGSFGMVGTQLQKIKTAIKLSKQQRDNNLYISANISSKGRLNILLKTLSLPKDSKFLLIRFFKKQETSILAGENKGKKLISYNIVNHWSILDGWDKKSLKFSTNITPLKDNEACAILVQDNKTKQIYSSALCRK